MTTSSTPDVVLRQADALPYGGTWRGHEGMARFFEAMGRTWASFDLFEQDYGTPRRSHRRARQADRAGPNAMSGALLAMNASNAPLLAMTQDGRSGQESACRVFVVGELGTPVGSG
ncbi:hypothetical protein GCM10027199_75700 [Amycolatopsis magusensis]